MATITNTIRWADNTADLKKNLLEGIGTVDAMKTSVDRMVTSLSGGGLFQAANRATAAILEMGGATKLTAAEQERYSALLDKAIEKYKTMGMTAPPEMVKVADSIRKTSGAWKDFVDGFDIKQAFSDPIGTAKNALGALAGSMGTTAVQALAMGSAVIAAGAAIFKLTSDAAKAGAELDDMHDKTGMSVPVLSKLSLASDVAGTSLAAMTDVVFKLERGIGEGGAKFEEGLQKMGLSTAQLKAAGPDRYLDLVVMGLKNIEDPADRAAAGTAVLGKGYRDVAANLHDLATTMQMTADIEPWTEQEAAQAEQFEFAVKSLTVHVQQLAIALGRELIPVMTTLVGWLGPLASAIKTVAYEWSGVAGIFDRVSSIISYGSAAYDVLRGKVEAPIKLDSIDEAKKKIKELADAAKDAALSPDALVKKWKEGAASMAAAFGPDAEHVIAATAAAEQALTKSATESMEAHKKAAETAKKHADELAKNTEAARKLEAGFFGLEKSVGAVDDRELNFVRTSVALRAELDKVEQTAHIANFGYKGMADGLENVGTKVRDLGPDIAHQFVGPVQEAAKVSVSAGEKIKTNLGQSFGGLTDTFARALEGGGGVKGAVQSFATTALSGVLSVVPLIGPVLSKFAGPIISGFKKIFGGASEEEKKGRADVAAFEKQLASTLTATQKNEAAGRSWAMTTIAVRDAFLATGKTAAEADVVVKQLWDTKNPEAYKGAIDQINAEMNEQAEDQKRAKELIDEYGISIEQLGPKFQQQQLDEQAKTLMNDYRLMVDVLGVDAPAAMELMADKMNAFVQSAISSGAEVPASMRPMLEKMADMGLLTDSSGTAITDLGDAGIKFAETMTESTDRIIAKFDELIARMFGAKDAADSARDAAAKVPPHVTTTITTVHEDVYTSRTEDTTNAARGGVISNHGVLYFPGGGFVPHGTDTVPAMLTPGEGVLSRGDMAALGGPGGFRALRHGLHAGGGGGESNAAALSALLQSQQRTEKYLRLDFKNDLARAVRDEVQKVA